MANIKVVDYDSVNGMLGFKIYDDGVNPDTVKPVYFSLKESLKADGTIDYEKVGTHIRHRYDFDAFTSGLTFDPASLVGNAGSYETAIPEPTAEEVDAQLRAAIRGQRNLLLWDSDWTQSVSDISDEKRAEWAAYRQALRDVTLQATFPDSVTWPDKPA